MQNISYNLLLFCVSTWPSYLVTENHLYTRRVYRHQEIESEHQLSNGSLTGLFSLFILSHFTWILELDTNIPLKKWRYDCHSRLGAHNALCAQQGKLKLGKITTPTHLGVDLLCYQQHPWEQICMVQISSSRNIGGHETLHSWWSGDVGES